MKYYNIVFSLIIILLAIYGFNKDKNILNPYRLFNIWWGIILLLSSIEASGLYLPRPQTYFIMYISMLSFNLPYILHKKHLIKTENNVQISTLQISKNFGKILTFLNIIVLTFYFPFVINTTKLIIQGKNISIIRWLYYYPEVKYLGYLRILKSIVIAPYLLIINILVFSYLIYYKEKRKAFFLIIITTIIINITEIFVTFGRGLVIELFLISIIGYISNYKHLNSITRRNVILVITSIPIVFTLILTLKRNVFGSVFKEVLIYFGAPIIYFEKLYDQVYLPIILAQKKFLYGTLFFSGFIDIPILFLRLVGLNIIQPSYYLAQYNQSFVEVGNGLLYNAFPTMNFSYLIDFGNIGIIVGPLLFSFLIMYFYKKYLVESAIKYKIIFIVLLLAIYQSPMKFLGTSYSFWNSIFLIIIIDFVSKKIMSKKHRISEGDHMRTNKNELSIVFVSNYLNHHQLPLCLEFERRLKSNFKFIATESMSEERRKLGYKDMNDSYEFVIRLKEDNVDCIKDIINDADVVIMASAPKKLFDERLKSKKLTFRYSERILKKGIYKAFNPLRYVKNFYNFALKERNVYLLAASAYATLDYRIFGAYRDKSFQWGYFPVVNHYDPIYVLNQRSSTLKVKLLWVGRFIDWKHPEIVLEVAEDLISKGYNFEINMIGTGPLVSHINELICNKKLEKHVKYLGSMSPEEVRSIMIENDVFLFTSDFNEGWGAVLNEAMNSLNGVIVSHAIGSARFLVNDSNGLIYENGNTKDLIKNVEKLVKDPELRVNYSLNAYNTTAELWNAKIASERFIELSLGLLNGEDIIYSEGPMSKSKVMFERLKR